MPNFMPHELTDINHVTQECCTQMIILTLMMTQTPTLTIMMTVQPSYISLVDHVACTKWYRYTQRQQMVTVEESWIHHIRRTVQQGLTPAMKSNEEMELTTQKLVHPADEKVKEAEKKKLCHY